MTISDLLFVQRLRAMIPHNLNAHVERSVPQDGNETIAHIKALASKQRGSMELSSKTATSPDAEALSQIALCIDSAQ